MGGRNRSLRDQGNRLPGHAAGPKIGSRTFNTGRHRMLMPDITRDIGLFSSSFIRQTNVGVRILMVVMGRFMRMFMRVSQLMRPRRDMDAAKKDSERQK